MTPTRACLAANRCIGAGWRHRQQTAARSLWVITCDAQQSSEMGEASGLVGGAIWSFARVLANEMPRLSLRLVDLPSTLAANDRARKSPPNYRPPAPERRLSGRPRDGTCLGFAVVFHRDWLIPPTS